MVNDMLCDAEKVRAAADLLSASADAIKARRRRDFDAGRIDANTAADNIADETALREQATRLYIHANDVVIAAADLPQAQLLSAIQQADAQIASLVEFQAAVTVLAGLLTLAAAIATGKLGSVAPALKDLQAAVKLGAASPAAGP